jgi:hypothetical protein
VFSVYILCRKLLQVSEYGPWEQKNGHKMIITLTPGVSASYLSNGHEYWMPMDPIYYHEKSCCFRNTYTRCPLFKRKIQIGLTEPR